MSKLDFKEICYNPSITCFGSGNHITSISPMSTFVFAEMSQEEEDAMKADYELAKEIYDNHINKGATFQPSGKNANTSIIAKITFVNNRKQTVTWKQCNLSDEQISDGYKPAEGKFSISALIQLVKKNEIKFL
jgi:hypothetical protein